MLITAKRIKKTKAEPIIMTSLNKNDKKRVEPQSYLFSHKKREKTASKSTSHIHNMHVQG